MGAMTSKHPRKHPADLRQPRMKVLLFYAQSEAYRRRHKTEARYLQCERRDDWIYDLALRDGGYKCLRCGKRSGLRLDHIVPVSKGGKTELDNMQLLCPGCGDIKGNQIIDYRPRKPERG